MKKIFLGFLLMLGCASWSGAADDLTNRLGVGVNWQGLQVRYGVAEDWLAEAKMQFASNNTLAGLRGYRLFPELPRMIFPTRPYLGAEASWVFSEYLNGGVLSGVFGGLELLPARNLGIGFDMGLYYSNLWSTFGTVADLGMIANLNVTLYF